LRKKINHEGEINKARYMPQNPNILASKTISSEIHIFDINKHEAVPTNNQVNPELRLIGHEKEGFGLSWSSLKSGYLLSGSNDNKICIWDVSSNNTNPIITRDVHTSVVEDVAWNYSEENIFASVGDDFKLIIHDIRTNQPSFNISAHDSDINSLDFNRINGNLLITGSKDYRIKLWDLREMSRSLYTFKTEKDNEIYYTRWNSKLENVFMSANSDNTICVWDTNKIGEEQALVDSEENPELIFTHSGHVNKINDLSWNPHDQLMACSVSEDNVIQVWEMNNFIYKDNENYYDSENEEK